MKFWIYKNDLARAERDCDLGDAVKVGVYMYPATHVVPEMQECRTLAPFSPSDDSTLVPANDSTLALKNADSMGLRERAEKLVGTIRSLDGCVGGYEESIDALVAFVQSERQQAAEQMREACARMARKPYGDEVRAMSGDEPSYVGEKIARAISKLPLTGGA